MRYLVDANILSEPTKKVPDSKVVDWLRDNEREIVVDPIILGEVRFGILLLRSGRRRASLERWFDAGLQRLRCLPWEAETGLRWAQLLASLRTAGRAMPIINTLGLPMCLRKHWRRKRRNDRRDADQDNSRSDQKSQSRAPLDAILRAAEAISLGGSQWISSNGSSVYRRMVEMELRRPIATVRRGAGAVDRGLQISRRDRHAEIDARAAFDGAVHRGEIRQVALHYLGAEPTQGSKPARRIKRTALRLSPVAELYSLLPDSRPTGTNPCRRAAFNRCSRSRQSFLNG